MFNKPFDVFPQFSNRADRTALVDNLPMAGVYPADRPQAGKWRCFEPTSHT